MKTNTYTVFVNEPLYTGDHPCIAKNVTINMAIKAMYDARKRYIGDPGNESHGYIVWDQAPETNYADADEVFNMHFSEPNCMLNWQVRQYIKNRRAEIIEETAGGAS